MSSEVEALTGKIPFVATVTIGDRVRPIAMRFSHVSSFSKEAMKAWAHKHLTPMRNVVTDGLECFTALRKRS